MLEHYLWFITTNWFTVIVSLIVIMIMLHFATWMLENELSILGKKLKISPSVRWATFDAISSSLPEFLTSMVGLILLWNAWLEVGIWTIWGSAIFNILIIPAMVLLFYKWKSIIKVETSWVKRDTIFYVLSIFVFLAWLYFHELRLMWIALLILYVFYVYYLYKSSLKHRELNFKEVEQAFESVKNKKVFYLNILISLALIYIWVEASVTAASWIWDKLHISVLIVSLVLLAGITSIPDTLLSIKSSIKWDIDAGLSNAVGSNIFDICVWLWLPILIWTTLMWLSPNVDFNSQIGIFGFLFLSTIFYYGLLSKKSISKIAAFVLIWVYILFIVYLIYFVK